MRAKPRAKSVRCALDWNNSHTVHGPLHAVSYTTTPSPYPPTPARPLHGGSCGRRTDAYGGREV